MAPFADHRNFLCIVGGVLEVGLPRVCGECAEFEKVFLLVRSLLLVAGLRMQRKSARPRNSNAIHGCGVLGSSTFEGPSNNFITEPGPSIAPIPRAFVDQGNFDDDESFLLLKVARQM